MKLTMKNMMIVNESIFTPKSMSIVPNVAQWIRPSIAACIAASRAGPSITTCHRTNTTVAKTALSPIATVATQPDTGLPSFAPKNARNVKLTSGIKTPNPKRISNSRPAINFFDLGGRLTLVDLPGYGFARAANSEIKAWTALVRAYLRGRSGLRRVCLLIDARHAPKPADEEVMTILDRAAVVFQVVLTKADKLGAEALAARGPALARDLAARHPATHPRVLATSARSGLGIVELRGVLAALAEIG